MKLLIAVALLVVGLSPRPGSGQEYGSGDGKWLAMKCMQKKLFWQNKIIIPVVKLLSMVKPSLIHIQSLQLDR